jgi:hypothetical protein
MKIDIYDFRVNFICIHVLMAKIHNHRYGSRHWRYLQYLPDADSLIKADLKDCSRYKQSEGRGFTRLEKVLQDEWKDVTNTYIRTTKRRIAFAVWFNSQKTINFDGVLETCPLTSNE